MFGGNPLCFRLCSLPLVLSWSTSEKEPVIFASFFQVFIYIT